MRTWLFAGLCLMLANSAQAHKLKASIATANIFPEQGNIQIEYRFHLHDLEHALVHLFNEHKNVYHNDRVQQAFADYVYTHASLRRLNGQALALSAATVKIDAKYLWVYQEAQFAKGTPLKGLQMRHGALRDIWPDQINLVNFRGIGKVKTMHFDKDDNWLTVEFD
ncbi:hypothetical protein J8M20_18010 [Pseudoalteromonas luteoviolacea]|uniref:DUF6702 family protein n=1 Tax=Pseudoalteromonas luteoviolacea TaxID=43657 RepID=UPI001B3748BC|nr:DUF6702 family protein [Pseudoalteromonas luteoviolacea]MBQ4813262.1 hypothetical protein [Pseudoalteromonas luteoviolacea]